MLQRWVLIIKGSGHGAIIQKYARVRSAGDFWTAIKFHRLKLETHLPFFIVEVEWKVIVQCGFVCFSVGPICPLFVICVRVRVFDVVLLVDFVQLTHRVFFYRLSLRA